MGAPRDYSVEHQSAEEDIRNAAQIADAVWVRCPARFADDMLAIRRLLESARTKMRALDNKGAVKALRAGVLPKGSDE